MNELSYDSLPTNPLSIDGVALTKNSGEPLSQNARQLQQRIDMYRSLQTPTTGYTGELRRASPLAAGESAVIAAALRNS